MKAQYGEVTELRAWIAEDEGIIAVYIPNMGWSPAVTYAEHIAKGPLRKGAEAVAKASGKRISLIRATPVEEVDHVGP